MMQSERFDRLGKCLRRDAAGPWMVVAAWLVALAWPGAAAYGVSLGTLVNGATLNFGSLSFHDWELELLDATAALGPTLSQIEVVPLLDDPMNPGLSFVANGQLVTAGINAIDMIFSFHVTPLSDDLAIDAVAMKLTGAAFDTNSGSVLISGAVTDGGGNDLGSPLVFVDNSVPFFKFDGSAEFARKPQIVVENNLFVTGVSAADGVSLDAFTQRFSLVPADLPGDADGDGDVDGFDLGIWQNQFGDVGPGLSADFDDDGDVDGFDLGLWQANFGTGQPANPVPEPGTAILSLVAGLVVVTRRHPLSAHSALSIVHGRVTPRYPPRQ